MSCATKAKRLPKSRSCRASISACSGALLGQVGGHLARHRAQQREHLGVERERRARLRHQHEADRHGMPPGCGSGTASHRLGQGVDRRLHAHGQVGHRDLLAGAEAAQQRMVRRERQGEPPACSTTLPTGTASPRPARRLAQEQHAGRAVHHLRHRADHPRMQRRPPLPVPASVSMQRSHSRR